jgi:ribosomal protein S18 acetylase RimI-like enzyme
MRGAVTTRPVRLPEDTDLLLAIYASTRQFEIAGSGWTDEEARAFVAFQFEAQSRYYAAYFAGSEHSVVLVEGVPAGRLVVERSENSVHVVDISLLPSFRRAGVGRDLVHNLIEEADGREVPVTCQVAAGNESRLFWERLGFVARGGGDAYIPMERPCPSSAL